MSVNIKPAGTIVVDTIGLVDMPYKQAWRRAHFLGGSADASRANLEAAGANPLTVVAAPTFTPGYAVVNAPLSDFGRGRYEYRTLLAYLLCRYSRLGCWRL